jgi:hypothetical protein
MEEDVQKGALRTGKRKYIHTSSVSGQSVPQPSPGAGDELPDGDVEVGPVGHSYGVEQQRPIDAVPEQSPSLAAAGSTRERRPPASQPFDEMPEPCKPAERSAATRESVRMQLRLGRNKQWRGVHP